jgi:flagellar FliJ protein
MQLDKLDKVAMLARSRENAAATDLHRKQQDLQNSNQRLDQLMSFKSEYEARLEVMARSGMDARQLADYRRFLGSLNDAIRTQGEDVDRSRDRVDASRDAYIDRSLRRGSVDELISRSRAALAADEARREQRASDESAMARYPRTRD